MDSRSIPFARPMITQDDINRVVEVLKQDRLACGPQVKAFEEAFATHLYNAPLAYPIAVSSCTSALHLAYLLIGIGPGDEVICPALTHVSAAHAIEITGAKPVFVDCDSVGLVTADGIGRALTPQTKAISVMHYLGMPCDMKKITLLALRRGLPVVEDCALALGATIDGQSVGTWGNFGAFSFYPTKHITAGEGGMLVVNCNLPGSKFQDLATLRTDATFQRAFGVVPNIEGEGDGYDVPLLGLNARMTEMQAALLIPQLARLSDNLLQRQRNFNRVVHFLAVGTAIEDDVMPVGVQPWRNDTNAYYALGVFLPSLPTAHRQSIRDQLKNKGIETSVYYPTPVPLLTYYQKKYGYMRGQFPCAEEMSARSFVVPIGPHLAKGDVDYIGEQVTQTITRQLNYARKAAVI
jgi:perosamine synthetase